MLESNVDFSRVVDRARRFFDQKVDTIRNSSRIFHGRGGVYSGLNFISVDYFSPVILVTLFKSIDEANVIDLSKRLLSLHASIQAVYVQKRFSKNKDFCLVCGSPPDNLYAHRNGCNYSLSLSRQNVGFFLDAEPARQWLETEAKGRSILNLFAYTCAFSVVAKAAGARSVVNMDMSSNSLSVGRENHRQNDVSLDGVSFFSNDIFKSWSRLKRFGPYDIVVLDPPSFQQGSFVAETDYAKLFRRMKDLVTEHGMVLACLNSPQLSMAWFGDLANECLEGFKCVKRLESDSSFPDVSKDAALKMIVYQKSSSA